MDPTTANRPPLVRSVLHPTDFSKASERAFANALAIALLRQTRLTLLHVHDKGSTTDWSKFPAVRETLERWGLLEQGSSRADVYARLRVEVAKVELTSRFPALAVARYLHDHPHDLVVLATEGEAGLSSWFSRSTSETIAGASGAASLFVPASADRGLVSLESAAYTMRSILVPVAEQPSPRVAIELATRTAETFGEERVEITLLHVGTQPAPWPSTPRRPEWTFHKEQVDGEVVAEILRAAQRLESDVIVMPTAGHQTFLEMLRGSTTEQVLRKARCPVLAVPATRD